MGWVPEECMWSILEELMTECRSYKSVCFGCDRTDACKEECFQLGWTNRMSGEWEDS